MIDPELDGGVRTNTDRPSPPPREVLLDWQLHQRAEAIIMALHGELDMVTAPALRAALTEILIPGRIVVVDTAGLRFCGAGGLAVLAQGQHRARTRGAQLRVVITPGSHLARVWIITGLAHDLPPYADREAAAARGAPRSCTAGQTWGRPRRPHSSR